jgi:hypothetical protein
LRLLERGETGAQVPFELVSFLSFFGDFGQDFFCPQPQVGGLLFLSLADACAGISRN